MLALVASCKKLGGKRSDMLAKYLIVNYDSFLVVRLHAIAVRRLALILGADKLHHLSDVTEISFFSENLDFHFLIHFLLRLGTESKQLTYQSVFFPFFSKQVT
jgi:hypothetical protein